MINKVRQVLSLAVLAALFMTLVPVAEATPWCCPGCGDHGGDDDGPIDIPR